MVKLAGEVNSRYQLVESVDVKVVRELSWTAAGLLPPLATAIGGIVAQETLISLTGKFSPLRQWVREGGVEGERGRDCNTDVVLQLFLDAAEVLANSKLCDPASFQPRYINNCITILVVKLHSILCVSRQW